MSAEFVPNMAVIDGVRLMPGVIAACLELANQIRDAAAAQTPPHDITYGYENGLVASPIAGGARVSATDYKSVWIEFGTGEPAPTPAFAPLRTAAEGARL
jgi:hypothetical protein